jgi:hypothetical protein
VQLAREIFQLLVVDFLQKLGTVLTKTDEKSTIRATYRTQV